eukprot:UN02459
MSGKQVQQKGKQVQQKAQQVQNPSRKKTKKSKKIKKKQPKPTRAQRKVKRRKQALKERMARRKRIEAYRAKATSKFQIRCRKPVEDDIFDVDEFVKYIKEHFKVDGKTGAVGPGRSVNVQKSVSTVHVMSKKPF